MKLTKPREREIAILKRQKKLLNDNLEENAIKEAPENVVDLATEKGMKHQQDWLSYIFYFRTNIHGPTATAHEAGGESQRSINRDVVGGGLERENSHAVVYWVGRSPGLHQLFQYSKLAPGLGPAKKCGGLWTDHPSKKRSNSSAIGRKGKEVAVLISSISASEQVFLRWVETSIHGRQ